MLPVKKLSLFSRRLQQNYNFDFGPEIKMLAKNLIFDPKQRNVGEHFNFQSTIEIVAIISIFGQKFNFQSKHGNFGQTKMKS